MLCVDWVTIAKDVDVRYEMQMPKARLNLQRPNRISISYRADRVQWVMRRVYGATKKQATSVTVGEVTECATLTASLIT